MENVDLQCYKAVRKYDRKRKAQTFPFRVNAAPHHCRQRISKGTAFTLKSNGQRANGECLQTGWHLLCKLWTTKANNQGRNTFH